MNYQPMLPVVDEWVLWVLCLFVPLVALCALTAFIVLHRERHTATPEKKRLNLIMASSSGLLVLFILGFMLYSGLRLEANQTTAANNLIQKYDITSVEWKTPQGRKVNPDVPPQVIVTDADNAKMKFNYKQDPETNEPFLEPIEEEYKKVTPESLLR